MSGPAPIETVMAAASPGTERTARSMHLFFHIHVPARHRGGTTNRAASPLTLPILAAENDNRGDFRKETNPIVVVEENYRSERAERFVDVRILLDLRHLLGVLDDPVLIDDDDCPGHHASERAIGDLHAVIIAEGGTENRARYDVLDTLRCAEAPVGEGKVCRYAQDLRVLQARSALAELTSSEERRVGKAGSPRGWSSYVCSSGLDCPGHHASERAIGDLHAVIIAEGGTENRARYDVLDTLRCAEAPVGEGKVCRYAQDLRVLQARSALVELTHAVRADARVEGGEDVEHHPLAAEVLETDLAEFIINESEFRCLAPYCGKLPHRVDRISIERNLCHKRFLPHSNVCWVTPLRVSLTPAAATPISFPFMPTRCVETRSSHDASYRERRLHPGAQGP